MVRVSDVKIGDFTNGGDPAIVQATGFVKGQVNRWPQLQELATSDDAVTSNPFWWPNLQPGDDIGGDQTLHLFAKTPDGRYADIAPELGLAVPVPTRKIATGDSTGTGRLDLAVARQWDAPVFYRNDSPATGAFLGLNLTLRHPRHPGPAARVRVRVRVPDDRRPGHRHHCRRAHLHRPGRRRQRPLRQTQPPSPHRTRSRRHRPGGRAPAMAQPRRCAPPAGPATATRLAHRRPRHSRHPDIAGRDARLSAVVSGASLLDIRKGWHARRLRAVRATPCVTAVQHAVPGDLLAVFVDPRLPRG